MVDDNLSLEWKEIFANPRCLWRKDTDETSEQVAKKDHYVQGILGCRVSLEGILLNLYDEPVDLRHFGLYCETELTEDMLSFILIVQRIKDAPPEFQEYQHLVNEIVKVYLQQGGSLEINVEVKKKEQFLAQYRSNDKWAHPQYGLFDGISKAAMNSLQFNSFARFIHHFIYEIDIPAIRSQTFWCCNCHEASCSRFFTFPVFQGLSYTRSLRFVEIVLCTLIVFELIMFESCTYSCGYLAITSLARAICGPRLDVTSLLIVIVSSPLRIKETGYVFDENGRFKTLIYVFLSGSMLLLQYMQVNWVVICAIAVALGLTSFIRLKCNEWCFLSASLTWFGVNHCVLC
uniref:RGS domain-containing protein n=1 Tax=Lotharella globosa TaxID=91324 RepID=A0A7S3YIK1_9EUKA